MTYSRLWYQTFLEQIPPHQTEHEVAFLRRMMPADRYPNVLDICCGSGRHAVPLAESGYAVTGIDRNKDALRLAEKRSERVTFLEWDMRQIGELEDTFDAVVNLWASFGYFDHDTNADILTQIHRRMRPAGLFILDVYNKDFFVNRQGSDIVNKNGAFIRTTNQLDANRLRTELIYDDGTIDRFDWEVFSPGELADLAVRAGFQVELSCTMFDEAIAVHPDSPRMQFVMMKPAGS